MSFLSAAQVGDQLKLARDPFFGLHARTELGEPPVSDADDNFVILSLFEEVVIKM